MLQGIINWKKCKNCGMYFDIGTNKDICLECRLKKVKNECKKKF